MMKPFPHYSYLLGCNIKLYPQYLRQPFWIGGFYVHKNNGDNESLLSTVGTSFLMDKQNPAGYCVYFLTATI